MRRIPQQKLKLTLARHLVMTPYCGWKHTAAACEAPKGNVKLISRIHSIFGRESGQDMLYCGDNVVNIYIAGHT